MEPTKILELVNLALSAVAELQKASKPLTRSQVILARRIAEVAEEVKFSAIEAGNSERLA